MSSNLDRRVSALEERTVSGGPAYVFLWDDDDEATKERKIRQRRVEMPDAREIIAITWGGST